MRRGTPAGRQGDLNTAVQQFCSAAWSARSRAVGLLTWANHTSRCLGEGPTHAERLLEGGDAHPSLSSPAAGGCEGRDDDVRSYSDA